MDDREIAASHAMVFDEQIAEAIARDTGAPIDFVTRVYKEELHTLTCGARITQFVNVLASRRARMRVQKSPATDRSVANN
ncbi:MAG TPA: DUF3562 domain-containing protein [Steroidobacter sp.]|uniref:DUF3562 domain-containing protein n=1 Tax=Steroidobacter sp. TaxID=1978227 RepID=UPI002EDB6CFC